MKGNQGLEALAALCGGQTDAPTDQARGSSSSASEVVSSGSRGAQAQQSQSSVLQQGQRQNPLSTQSPLQNVTQQQWQQAIAAAAALQGNGVNPALAAQSLLLSSPGFSSPENTFSPMQQLAFHQYMQAQAKLSAQQAAQSLASGGSFGDQGQQALLMALAAGKAQQLQHVQGELISKFTLRYLVFSVVESSWHWVTMAMGTLSSWRESFVNATEDTTWTYTFCCEFFIYDGFIWRGVQHPTYRFSLFWLVDWILTQSPSVFSLLFFVSHSFPFGLTSCLLSLSSTVLHYFFLPCERRRSSSKSETITTAGYSICLNFTTST